MGFKNKYQLTNPKYISEYSSLIKTSLLLSINPYFEPFLTLWAWTNPVFTFGRTLYPKFFGLDLTPIVNYKILQKKVQIMSCKNQGETTGSLLLQKRRGCLGITMTLFFAAC